MKHVHKHQMHVPNVSQEIIQVEQDVQHAQQLKDVPHVHKPPKHVQNVIQDIIYQVEVVLNVLTK